MAAAESAHPVVLAWQSLSLLLTVYIRNLFRFSFERVPICAQGIRRGWATGDGQLGREGLGLQHQVPRAQERRRRRCRQQELPRHLRQRKSLCLST